MNEEFNVLLGPLRVMFLSRLLQHFVATRYCEKQEGFCTLKDWFGAGGFAGTFADTVDHFDAAKHG